VRQLVQRQRDDEHGREQQEPVDAGIGAHPVSAPAVASSGDALDAGA
jgi:hypothetical protein